MTRRLAFTPAFGLFAASMVSFGAVSMWLAGVHGSPAHVTATTQCSAASAKKGAVRMAAYPATTHTTARLPVLLDAATRSIHAGGTLKHSAARGAAAASSTSPPAPGNDPQPSASATDPVPDPTPGGGNVAPSTSPATPDPGSSRNVPASQRPDPTVSPGGTNKSTKSPTSTPTPTPTPTPTSTTTPPPTAKLCLSVQTLGGSNRVRAGTTVHYAIFVWLSSGTGGTAKISVDASPSKVKPTFSVCEPTGKTTCKLSGLGAAEHVEAQARLRAFDDMAGRDINLTVTAKSDQATNTATASDKIEVTSKNGSASPTPTPTNAGTGGTGDGSALPPGVPGNSGYYPGPSNSTGNLGSAFPQVSPSPNASLGAPGHRPKHHVALTDLSAGLPLDVRLIGGQVIGLAILAAAVTIAVARLSLRRQPARHSDDNTGSTPTT